jgi:Carboxypeptidase regulatory-like domain/TonB dependent receptor-like, beta-barrel
MRQRHTVHLMLWLLLAAMVASPVLAQVNAVDLSGTVYDPQGLAVVGAKVTVRNLATGATRGAVSGADGGYKIVGLPPGRFELTVEAKGMAKLVNPELVLTLGVAADFDAHMVLQGGEQTVTVSGEPDLIETRRTAVSETVTPLQIDNLPINGRNYINFTLLDSQIQRDSAPSIGAAPTSGLNFGGQRARSNEVSVDGADAVDNSVNGIRATVSQEAVQEFQIIVSNYMPEFGRATGGVVNIVTKSGSNQTHGDIFGFLRHKSIQARNPFSVQVDPTTGATTAIKQPFTRVQAGLTLGGPIQKDKTFYFFSYETTRRQESGFTNIGAASPGTGAFGLVPSTTPALPGVTLMLTPEQQAFVNNPLVLGAPGGVTLIQEIFALGGSGASVGLHGIDPGLVAGGSGINFPFGPGPGARFPLPIDCGILVTPPTPCSSSNLVSLPTSFVPLTSLLGNYPVSEGTSLWSLRLDHIWNSRNNSFIRASVSPSLVTGIQVNAQNQNFGENAGSRTSLQQSRDLAIVGQHVTTFTNTLVNEARYQFARRGLHYGFSQLPGGSSVAVNITGFAFFGREPFSTVDRIERRHQVTDNLTWVTGRHTWKFGGDYNLIQLRSSKPEIFELNFGGIFNFGGLSASTFGFPSSIGGVSVPGFSAVQAYGLGLPQVFIQGIGNSSRPFDNKTLGVFLQDSWKLNSRLALNYGVRYDIEWTPTFTPATALNVAAEPKMGVLEGIPVDGNNVQPRIGFAWDPTGSGKTVIRGGYGIFYDHPLLAVAFNSTTADGALSSQLVSGGGTPTAVSPLLNPAALNAATLFQGVLGGIPSGGVCGPGVPASFGYLCNQQRFDPLLSNSIFTNQSFITAGLPIPILPFTLPVARSFVYSSAQQTNLTIERELTKDWKLGVAYNFIHGVHLNRPRNINAPIPAILVNNANKAVLAGLDLPGTNPILVQVPTGSIGSCVNTAGGGSILLNAPSILGTGFSVPNCNPAGVIGLIGTPAVFNFFRPSGPNPSFATAVGGGNFNAGYAQLVALATAAGFPQGFGVPVPWSDVDQQESSGNSLYHGMTVTLTKRFSNHAQLFMSYTWSHSIDDSTDLQTLLNPQDNRQPNLERSNSTFDQRHRWVMSAVLQSPYKTSEQGFWHKFLADFTMSPVFEASSGRPFTVLTGSDLNLDFGSNTDRPSAIPLPPGAPLPAGAVRSPFINGVAFLPPTVCDTAAMPLVPSPPFACTGNLGRNAFTRPGFFTIDLRVSRKFSITERWKLEAIADGFNLLNRFNAGDVNPLCDPTSGAGACNAGQVTAANDPRQFQFALKVSW